jgi:hypothetical protein
MAAKMGRKIYRKLKKPWRNAKVFYFSARFLRLPRWSSSLTPFFHPMRQLDKRWSQANALQLKRKRLCVGCCIVYFIDYCRLRFLT